MLMLVLFLVLAPVGSSQHAVPPDGGTCSPVGSSIRSISRMDFMTPSEGSSGNESIENRNWVSTGLTLPSNRGGGGGNSAMAKSTAYRRLTDTLPIPYQYLTDKVHSIHMAPAAGSRLRS